MIQTLCKRAYEAKPAMLRLTTACKNDILRRIAAALIERTDEIIAENKKDIDAGRTAGLSEALIDRLALTPGRIEGMAASLHTIADFPDPVGSIEYGFRTESGLTIEKVRTPLGVIGIIYESRPNVTVDAAALCLKAGNVAILRGSSSAIHSNKYLANLFNEVGKRYGLPDAAVQLIEDTDRAVLDELIRQDGLIDVLIPRGGKGLKKYISQNGSIPVIVTGAGTCHAFVDASADPTDAVAIIINGKTQRPSTCNSLECILVHRNTPDRLVNDIVQALTAAKVRVNCTKQLTVRLEDENRKMVHPADESAFGTEYLSLEILMHEVAGIDDAIAFINRYGTNHSDVILTKDLENAEKFLNDVDSACVYLNASTRFSDGGEFGFGGEIGISTQKLHARGPMGIKELTGLKYVIRGKGEVRA
ncbi:MAG: glutamate-5-semialdehyde dehydrogenase [Eubacteriales bacterium]|nr:glutamate-5-semialdehyde dehydrogenase [Eubacteriales bacterium]